MLWESMVLFRAMRRHKDKPHARLGGCGGKGRQKGKVAQWVPTQVQAQNPPKDGTIKPPHNVLWLPQHTAVHVCAHSHTRTHTHDSNQSLKKKGKGNKKMHYLRNKGSCSEMRNGN